MLPVRSPQKRNRILQEKNKVREIRADFFFWPCHLCVQRCRLGEVEVVQPGGLKEGEELRDLALNAPQPLS